MRRSTRIAATGVLVATLVGGCGFGGDDDASGSGGSDGSGASAGSTTTAAPTTTTPPPELPLGGREIFPAYRVVALYGNAQSTALGVLGETPPEEAAQRVLAAAAPFAQPDRPVQPAFELIVSVAQRAPGEDGNHSVPTPDGLILQWLDAARAANALLILDIQPGSASFLPEAQRFEALLREPDVGLALDPEWRMAPGEIPGEVIGSVSAAEVNEVSAWLAGIVEEERLPEKLFVLHQFTEGMIADRDTIEDRPGLATVFHIDGFGGRAVKLRKYAQLAVEAPYANGLKLFYDEDIDIFQPGEVLTFGPDPDLITYQ